MYFRGRGEPAAAWLSFPAPNVKLSADRNGGSDEIRTRGLLRDIRLLRSGPVMTVFMYEVPDRGSFVAAARRLCLLRMSNPAQTTVT